jgi:ubiquinone/menaquinone biosynthesis C-methylase UbiE
VPEPPVFHGELAGHYEEWYDTPEGRRADEFEKASLSRLLENFPHARSVMEVGCGTGHFARWLGQQDLFAVGLDLSADMLAAAQLLDGLPLVQADAHRLPFADRTFDLVALVTTLEFLREPRVALGEAIRVSRQGMVLGVLNRWSLLGLKRRLRERFRPTVYQSAHFYGIRELARLLKSVAGEQVGVVWQTTLFPRPWPSQQSSLPWGGFIDMALLLPQDAET